ncbi:uncharacterized protein METZ01_LOCUS468281 [marine metagenome]|uniref:Transposase DDE domain-containing protein n=1 Tax=marine metagenome TaxID=408172 RepID=A0A383B5P3_9ZZZZ
MPVRLRVLGVDAWLAVWLHDNAGPDPEPHPMQSPKRPQYKYAKSRYRVRNWGEYETGLRRRGDLTVWLSKEGLDAWRAPPCGQRRYADIAIEAAHTIRTVFHRRWCMARNVGRFPGPESRSSHLIAVGHPKQRHSVEDLAPNLHLYSFPLQASTPHVSTHDRLVSVDGVLHHAALAVA